MIEDDVYVTTVWHGRMDIERMLPEYEPALLHEVNVLRRKLSKKNLPDA